MYVTYTRKKFAIVVYAVLRVAALQVMGLFFRFFQETGKDGGDDCKEKHDA
jgi:hypothetical protein